MKTAKILKKSVLTPGNNWISLLNSANLSKKKAVTPVNFHLYHYASNNPVRYTDPDGRDHGIPPSIQACLWKYFSSQEFDFTEYNLIQQCKKGPMEFNTSLLTQIVNGKVTFPVACIYFSMINSLLMAGFKPSGVFIDGLDKFVNDNRFDENGDPVLFSDMASKVFSLSVTWKEIPAGLDEEQLKAKIGDNPAVLYYDQKKFWGNENLEGKHGIAYYNGNMFEPYMDRAGTDFSDVRGRNSDAILTDYIGGFYLEINQE